MPDAALINLLLVTLALGVAATAARPARRARIRIPVESGRRRTAR